MSKLETQNKSISFWGLLIILFVGLKLTGNITWSWWWILSPLWISMAVILIIVLVVIFLKILSK